MKFRWSWQLQHREKLVQMEATYAINQLRARFLQSNFENEQMKRIIRPLYPLNQDVLSTNGSRLNNKGNDVDRDFNRFSSINDIYIDAQGNNMIERLQSPPILTHFMHDLDEPNNLITPMNNGLNNNSFVFEGDLRNNDNPISSGKRSFHGSNFEGNNDKFSQINTPINLDNDDNNKNNTNNNSGNKDFNTFQKNKVLNEYDSDLSDNGTDTDNHKDILLSNEIKKEILMDKELELDNIDSKTSNAFTKSKNKFKKIFHKNKNKSSSRKSKNKFLSFNEDLNDLELFNDHNNLGNSTTKKSKPTHKKNQYSLNFDYNVNFDMDDDDEDDDDELENEFSNFFRLSNNNKKDSINNNDNRNSISNLNKNNNNLFNSKDSIDIFNNNTNSNTSLKNHKNNDDNNQNDNNTISTHNKNNESNSIGLINDSDNNANNAKPGSFLNNTFTSKNSLFNVENNISNGNINNNNTNNNNNNNNTNNNNSLTNSSNGILNNANVARLKSHFSQLPRTSLLDTTRNVSTKSEATSIGKSISAENLPFADNNKVTSNNDEQEEFEITDIDSYINEHDLDRLDLLESNEEDKNTMFKKINTRNQIEKNGFNEELGIIASNTFSVNDDDDDDDEVEEEDDDEISSDESSYSKSLLGSDFSHEYSLRNDSMTYMSNSLSIGSGLPRNTISSHSIPLSLEGYGGLKPYEDDSAMNREFDKAVINMKTNKQQILKGRKGSAISLRDSLSRSIPNRRLSSISIPNTRFKTHMKHRMRSASSVSNDRQKMSSNSELALSKETEKNTQDNNSNLSIKLNKHNNKHNKKNDKNIHKNKSYISNNNSNNASNSNILAQNLTITSKQESKGVLSNIKKISDFPKKNDNVSQLSSLFKKKKDKVTDPSEILEYFNFVSGNKVPKAESMQLFVYIQSSKKYKRKEFKTTVRKSAKIFEVIGYILYLYTTQFKPTNFEEDGMKTKTIIDPNNFNLKIVDEDGEPFEDNFGKLNRNDPMHSVSDNEVVLCLATKDEIDKNELETPLPYNLENGETTSKTNINYNNNLITQDNALNQLSFYKSIIKNPDDADDYNDKSKVIEVTVYMYPNNNPKFNHTNVKVLITSNMNDILVKYCRLKDMDPNEYCLKILDKKLIYDLNDTVLRFDGDFRVEIIPKKEARELRFEKLKINNDRKPMLPTIQSNGLTPLTLEPDLYLKSGKNNGSKGNTNDANDAYNTSKQLNSRSRSNRSNTKSSKLSSIKPLGYSSSGNSFSGNGFFKNRNSSKTSLHGTTNIFHNSTLSNNELEYTQDGHIGNNYQDLFSGAYHKYKVWRRQQMSLINKHERTLALDGDYVYIVPPEGKMHWHENVKTKSFHINQVVLVKKSKKIPENFKIYVQRGPDDLKRYFFEAISAQECTEIVSRIHNLMIAYRMNRK